MKNLQKLASDYDLEYHKAGSDKFDLDKPVAFCPTFEFFVWKDEGLYHIGDSDLTPVLCRVSYKFVEEYIEGRMETCHNPPKNRYISVENMLEL